MLFWWNSVFFSSQGFYRGQIDVFSVNFGENSWFSRSAHLAAVLATLRNRFFDEKQGIFIFGRNFERNPVTRVRGFWSIPENLWFLEGRVDSWTVQKAGKSKGGIEGNHQTAPIFGKLWMFSCDSIDRSIRRGKQGRNEPRGMIKSVTRKNSLEDFWIFMEFDEKRCPFEWAIKGSTAFSMISYGIYEFTRFTFAEMRFAGELKGLGDVRIRTKIDRNAPTRQEGLLAMFLTRNRCGSDDFGKYRQRFYANLCCARPLF